MKSRSMLYFIALSAVLFSLLGSTAAVTPVSANLPAELTASDWAQIQDFLPFAQQAYIKASNTGVDDQFSWSVAISGNTLVVGAPYEDSNAMCVNGNQLSNSALDSGAVYVFTRTGNTWSQQAYLKGSNTEAGDYFGISVAIFEDTLIVGATGEDSNANGVNGNELDNSVSNSGAVYVFTRFGNAWSQEAYLKASNPETYDYFGTTVSLFENTLAVGSIYEDSNAIGVNGNQSDNSASSAGAAYVFTRSDNVWSQQAYLKASNTEAFDFFGVSISLSGNTLVVGAVYEDSNATGVNGNQVNNSASGSGAAYVFTRSGSVWSQQAYLKASNTEVDDEFGRSVSLSGDTTVIGAGAEDSNATGINGNQLDNSAYNSGAAYVFFRSGGIWNQQAYLKSSNSEARDYFGSVAISEDILVVGATGEDSDAIGINGNQFDNSASLSGAAYVFTRTGNTWSQDIYLKASNTEAGDNFGYKITLFGNTIGIGSLYEASNTIGINGNQADNSASGSGATYVFIIPHTVTFNANGGSGSMRDQTASSPIALNTNAFTRTGYSFTGWNIAADGSGTSYADGASYDFAADVALYAQWSALANHTVTFNSNGGTGSMRDQVANVRTALTANTFTRAGYDFSGWNTAADGSGMSYANSAIYDFSADITLYAQWTAVNHTVTFNANGGSGSMSNQVANVPTALTSNTFTRAGYSFSGWNTTANGSGMAYANGATYDFSANITLYAQWTVATAAFADVPLDYWAWQYIESLYNSGITGGCSTNPLSYCPTQAVTRAQMAVFLLKGIHGSSYTPPAVGASTGFTDVPVDYWAAAWIKQLAAEGITGGCGAGIYCPENTVTRDQMAVFLLRAEHGSAYTPPAVGASTGFTDVPVDYWAAAWIKQLAAETITGGCGSGVYCPTNPVTRDQMAVFLQKTFNLPLP